MEKRIVEQQLIAQVWLVNRMAVKPFHETIHLHDLGPLTDQDTVLMSIHVCDLQGQTIWMGEIILILSGHVGATGQGNTVVQGAGKSLIGLPEKADALIIKLLEDRSRPINRPIVNND